VRTRMVFIPLVKDGVLHYSHFLYLYLWLGLAWQISVYPWS